MGSSKTEKKGSKGLKALINPTEKKKPFKKANLIIMAVELAIILTLILIGIFVRMEKTYDVPLSSWTPSGYTKEHEDGWYINNENPYFNGGVSDFKAIYGPYIKLPGGKYTVEIFYKTDNDRFLNVSSNTSSTAILSYEGIMHRNVTSTMFEFELQRDVDDLEITVDYNGHGFLLIEDIVIKKTNADYKRGVSIAIFIMVLLNLFSYFLKLDAKKKAVVVSLVSLAVFSTLPLLFSGVRLGGRDDFPFHLLRIEGIYKGLLDGAFPVKIAYSYIDGYGYPTGVYYGQTFLYIMAILRLLGFSYMDSYMIFVFLGNLATAIIAYFSFKGIFRSRKIGLLLSLVYTLASYRLENVYVRTAIGEWCAMTFLPLIAYGVYKLLDKDIGDFKKYRKSSLILALGIGGVFLSHMLSTEIVLFILVLVFLCFPQRTFRKKTILALLKGALETVFLVLFFAVPFVDYYLTQNVRINNIIDSGTIQIQEAGVSIGQLFSFFHNSQLSEPYMFLTPGIPLFIALIFGIITMIITKLKNKRILAYSIFSVILLFMTTKYFPWDLLAKTPIGNLISQIQFPWRLLCFATIFMTLIIGESIIELKKKHIAWNVSHISLVIVGLIISTSVFFSYYQTGKEQPDFQGATNLNSYIVYGGEYVLEGTNIYDNKGLICENCSAEIKEQRGGYLELSVKASEGGGKLTLPLYNYKGYIARDLAGNRYEIFDGENRQVALNLTPYFEGTIIVEFCEMWYWRVSEVISLTFVIYIAVAPFTLKDENLFELIKRKIKKRKNENEQESSQEEDGNESLPQKQDNAPATQEVS